MKKRKKQEIRGTIFVSPDGGETVYEQNKDGTCGKLVSQTQLAKDIDTGRDEEEMVGPSAIEMRRKYPALKKAWDQYRTVWGLIADNE
jgi:hypothetical protein